jgi:cytochrome c oxidase subunit 3
MQNKATKKILICETPSHLVRPSWAPLIASISIFLLFLNNILLITKNYSKAEYLLPLTLITSIYAIYIWTTEIRKEALEGNHTIKVQQGFYAGIILFLISEAMFFFGFFASNTYFACHSTLELGFQWPPLGYHRVNAMKIPLSNTACLICSGVFMTYAHKALKANKLGPAMILHIPAILLGILFAIGQFVEYTSAHEHIYSSVYGSLFYTLTGFHGLHVILGLIFLISSFCVIYDTKHPRGQFVFLDFAEWYWHFVDIVWILLVLIIYI